MKAEDEITSAIYPPRTAANPGNKWVAQVRKKGWLVNQEEFESEKKAQGWLSQHQGTQMSEAVKAEYLKTAQKWAQK